MLPEKIYLLVDYRGFFYSSVRNIDVGMDIELLRDAFSGYDIELIVIPYRDVVIDDGYGQLFICIHIVSDIFYFKICRG